MIRFQHEYNTSGSGLGCQISAYVLMMSLAADTDLNWSISSKDFNLLRNTFSGLSLVVDDSEQEYNDLELDDEVGYAQIKDSVKDNSKLFVYPTPANITSEHTDSIVKSLEFRQDIVDKCRAFRDQFDGEVIAMHIRRGDFLELASGMFVCGNDYYTAALNELPNDIPVLIFTNDKDSVIADNQLIASNPSRFTFITDLYNDNEFINCDVGQELDSLVDNDGKYTQFNYMNGLTRMAHNELKEFARDTNGYTLDQLKTTIKELSTQLHPTYRQKIKSKSYNASYDLCLMSMCDYVIMANSTFSLWGATLGNPKKVIYPMYWMQGHPEHPEQGSALIKTDLGEFNQTASLAGSFITDKFIPLENPDPRSFEVVS